MSVAAILQARMGSARLPGKVLMDLAGKPALELMVARVRRSRIDRIILATSTSPRDDVIARTAERLDLAVVRGPEDDVLARYVLASDAYPSDHVVRLTGDCPLADPEIIDDALSLHEAERADYTSNAIRRTFPDGLDVEVLRRETLHLVHRVAVEPADREHVTAFIHQHQDRFRISDLVNDHDFSDLRWTLDTKEDLEFLRGLVADIEDVVMVSWRELLERGGSRAT